MPKNVIKITTHLPAIPDWLKINNSVTIPLPIKDAKELAQKLLEVKDDVEIHLNFASGEKTAVEIKYESGSKK
jgi:S-adenosylmethionine synthetase